MTTGNSFGFAKPVANHRPCRRGAPPWPAIAGCACDLHGRDPSAKRILTSAREPPNCHYALSTARCSANGRSRGGTAINQSSGERGSPRRTNALKLACRPESVLAGANSQKEAEGGGERGRCIAHPVQQLHSGMFKGALVPVAGERLTCALRGLSPCRVASPTDAPRRTCPRCAPAPRRLLTPYPAPTAP